MTVSFRVMLYLAPEEVWELLIFAAGVFQGWARLTGKIVIRQIAATISIFLWSIITFSVAFSNIASTAAAIYSVVILINVLILIYLARDGGQKHDIIT